MNILITICARGGSKGIPGKNIKPINGIPLLHYTLKCAFEFAEIYHADVQLSTDDERIVKCAEETKYKTAYIRPDYLATDEAGKVAVIRHALEYAERLNNKKYDYVLDLDVTSPLRTLNDLEQAFDILKKDRKALNIFSVSPSSRNPYFNMVEKKGNNPYVKVVKSAGEIKSRQEAPIVYDMNASFYFFTKEFINGDYNTSTTERSLAFVVDHICFDLDNPIDFTLMEILLKEKLLDIKI